MKKIYDLGVLMKNYPRSSEKNIPNHSINGQMKQPKEKGQFKKKKKQM